VAAKLRDEDPFPQLEREIEAQEHGSAKAATRGPEVSPTERAARPLGRP
jgi:hypothetical protein